MLFLETLTWTELQSSHALLALPVGATEQHGPHLPLGTDTLIATALVRRLAAAIKEVVAAPPLHYGASGEHQDFAGTLSIGQEGMELVLVELVRSASHAFRRVLLVSAHGGNREPVERAVRRMREERRDVYAWSPAPSWRGDAHAGFTETSVMLALDRGSVRMEAARPGNVRPLNVLLPLLQRGGVAAVSPSGVLGDPTGADVESGERLLDSAADELVAAVRHWRARDEVWLTTPGAEE